MRIRVIFLHDVFPKYKAGDIRAVAGGYARNYLIPQGLAAPATGEHLKRVEKIKVVAEEQRKREVQGVLGISELLNGTSLTVKVRAGEGGRLYGSVTSAQIAHELSQITGQEIDRRSIQLEESIKEVGVFEVPVRLHHEVVPVVNVVVEDERGPIESPVPASSEQNETTLVDSIEEIEDGSSDESSDDIEIESSEAETLEEN